MFRSWTHHRFDIRGFWLPGNLTVDVDAWVNLFEVALFYYLHCHRISRIKVDLSFSFFLSIQHNMEFSFELSNSCLYVASQGQAYWFIMEAVKKIVSLRLCGS